MDANEVERLQITINRGLLEIDEMSPYNPGANHRRRTEGIVALGELMQRVKQMMTVCEERYAQHIKDDDENARLRRRVAELERDLRVANCACDRQEVVLATKDREIAELRRDHAAYRIATDNARERTINELLDDNIALRELLRETSQHIDKGDTSGIKCRIAAVLGKEKSE